MNIKSRHILPKNAIFVRMLENPTNFFANECKKCQKCFGFKFSTSLRSLMVVFFVAPLDEPRQLPQNEGQWKKLFKRANQYFNPNVTTRSILNYLLHLAHISISHMVNFDVSLTIHKYRPRRIRRGGTFSETV